MDQGQTILVVGDETRERDALTDLLKAEGYQLFTATTCEQALDTARKRKPALALIDLWLADLPGHVVLHGVRQVSPDTECIALLTSPAQLDGAYEALKLGAYTFLRRAYDAKQLLNTLQRALEKRDGTRALEDVKQRLALLFDALPVGVLIVDDRTGAVVDANPAAVRYMGAPKTEIIGAILQSRAMRSDTPPAPGATTPTTPPPPDATAALRQTGRRIPATRTVSSMTIGGRRHRVECFVDISGRLEAEDQLAAANTLNHALLEDVKDLVISVDRHGAVLRTFRTPSHGTAPEVSQDSAALLPASCRDRYRQSLNDVFRLGRGAVFSAGTPPFEAWSVRIDPVQIRGETLAAVVRVRDLSALERAAQRQQFREAIVAQSREPVLVLNTDGTIVDANEAAARTLEYQPVELIGMGYQQLDHPETPRPWAQLWAAAAAQGHVEITSRHRTRNGRMLPVHLDLVHVVHGGTALLLAYMRDTTATQRMAEIAANAELRERVLLGAHTDPAWVLDRAGEVHNLNEAAAQLSGHSIADAIGNAYATFAPPGLGEPRKRRLEDVFIRGKPVSFEDHTAAHRYAVTIAPIRDRDGTIVAALLLSRDLTAARVQRERLDLLWSRGQAALLALDLTRLPPLLPETGAQEPELEAWLQEHPDRVQAVLAAAAITEANSQAVQLLEKPADRLTRDGLTPLLAESSARLLANALLRLAARAVTADDAELVFATGTNKPLHANVRALVQTDQDGRPHLALLSLLDCSARIEAQSEVLDTSARERQRIGSELADPLLPPLLEMTALVQRLQTTLSQQAPALAGDADTLLAGLRALQAKAARIGHDIAFETSGDVSLMAALGKLADDANARWGVACRCNLRTAGLINDRTLGSHLYGIAREAVDFAVRRRAAKQVTITITASPREGVLTIKDDGTDPIKGDAQDLAQRLMRIHADLLRATLESDRDPRGTTTITCRFPNG